MFIFDLIYCKELYTVELDRTELSLLRALDQ